MGQIRFFDISSRTPAQRLSIIEKYRQSEVSTDYMEFGKDYFDNPEHTLGYHGYKYDGRYASAVEKIINHYNLKPGDKVLEIGCAKGFVLIEFLKKGLDVTGLDFSKYAVDNAHPDLKDKIINGDIASLPFDNEYFDFVIAKEILPHVHPDYIDISLLECNRVSKGKIFFEIQCGGTDLELEWMGQWDRTHKILKTPSWWNNKFQELNIPCDVHYNILIPEK